jgi:hypothetical protein
MALGVGLLATSGGKKGVELNEEFCCVFHVGKNLLKMKMRFKKQWNCMIIEKSHGLSGFVRSKKHINIRRMNDDLASYDLRSYLIMRVASIQ